MYRQPHDKHIWSYKTYINGPLLYIKYFLEHPRWVENESKRRNMKRIWGKLNSLWWKMWKPMLTSLGEGRLLGNAFTQGLSTAAKHRNLCMAIRFEAWWHRTRCGREAEQGSDTLCRLPINLKKKSYCFKSQTLLSMMSWSPLRHIMVSSSPFYNRYVWLSVLYLAHKLLLP